MTTQTDVALLRQPESRSEVQLQLAGYAVASRDDVLPVCNLEQLLFNLVKETAHDAQLDVG